MFLLNYEHSVSRRVRREPVSYILGTREFWSLDFEVTPDVLIPRPETELIVEEALVPGRLDRSATLLIYDIGTGSGVLAVALAREFPNARVVATDVSGEALVVASRNAARHGVGDRVQFIQTSYLDDLAEPADLIVSNPPYVPLPAKPALTPEVRDYEPSVAVFAGDDGLEGPRQVVAGAVSKLKPGGWLMMEFGYGQDDAVADLIAATGELSVEAFRGDLQDIPRTAVARKRA
jgi:release factor glutamine methyltransferase